MGFDIGVVVPKPDWAKALLYTNVVGNFVFIKEQSDLQIHCFLC